MNNFPLVRYNMLVICFTLVPLLAFSTSRVARADSFVAVEPALAGDPGSQNSLNGLGLINLDTGTLSFPIGIYAARAAADDNSGILKAYASSTQTQGAVAMDPLLATATSAVFGDLRFIGPGRTPIPITVSMDVEGTMSGNALNTLGVNLTASTGNTTWFSALSFVQYGKGSVVAGKEADKITTNGDILSHSPFPGGMPIVFSAEPDLLQGRLFLPLLLTPEQVLSLSADLNATSEAYSDENLNYTGTFNGTSDGFNTSKISFLLPTGYSLVANDSGTVFSGVPVLSTVPEPSTYALILAGLSLIGSLVRRASQTKAAGDFING